MIQISDILLTELMNDSQYAKNLLKTTRNKPIVDAIQNRKKITFFYTGPKRPKKSSVKAGTRVKVEPVALGLNKKGNLVLRAWVEPPSVSKKGFEKTNWRTFILARTSNLEVTDETFDVKRPGYNDTGDRSMTKVYAKTDWGKKLEPKKVVKPKVKQTKVKPPTTVSEPVAEPTVEPEVQPETPPTELPQPKPKVKPAAIKKSTVTTEPETPKQEPEELPQPETDTKPAPSPEEDEENKNLQEAIKKIKHLMFS